jgi:hypothetical protein
MPETITAHDLLDAMADAGVLEVFCHLPRAAQDEFSSWIGKARDDESHWRRIEALVAAMRRSSLVPPGSRGPGLDVHALG